MDTASMARKSAALAFPLLPMSVGFSFADECALQKQICDCAEVPRQHAIVINARTHLAQSSMRFLENRAGLERSKEVECLGRGAGLNGEHVGGVGDHFLQ